MSRVRQKHRTQYRVLFGMFVSLYPYVFRTTARKYRQHDTTPPPVGLNSINNQFTPTTLLSERLRMWSALGLGKCSCQSSVMVRRRALALLLEHGVLGHESLSVCEL